MASSRTAWTGRAVPAQIWPCGCGFVAPIVSPRFSNTWTQRNDRAELGRLVGPQVDDRADRGRRHPGHRQVVARREADHPAGPALALGPQQPDLEPGVGCVRPERREVVGEHERLAVGRVRIRRSPGRCRGTGSSPGRRPPGGPGGARRGSALERALDPVRSRRGPTRRSAGCSAGAAGSGASAGWPAGVGRLIRDGATGASATTGQPGRGGRRHRAGVAPRRQVSTAGERLDGSSSGWPRLDELADLAGQDRPAPSRRGGRR